MVNLFDDAHIIWTMLKERYDNSKCDEKLLLLEKTLEECSTSTTNDEPQVILPKGLMDYTASTSSPSHDLIDGNEMVGKNNAFTCGTFTFSSFCCSNILKEGEACYQWRPNDESTSPRSSTLHATSPMCLMAKGEKVKSKAKPLSFSDISSSDLSDSSSDDESSDEEIDKIIKNLDHKTKLSISKLMEDLAGI